MTKDNINFLSELKIDNKSYFMYLIYNPNLPSITYEQAIKNGIEPNPTTMFSEKSDIKEQDLPKGYTLFKKMGEIKL